MGDDCYILRRDEIAAFSGVSKTHFLNPDARRINKSLGDMTGLTGFGFHMVEVEPGDLTSEFHTHRYEDECVFILEGTATAFVGDGEYRVEAGDFIGYRKGGLAHAIRNDGQGILRCIVVGERAPHDVADYPKVGKRLYRNAGLAWDMVEIETIDHPVGGAK